MRSLTGVGITRGSNLDVKGLSKLLDSSYMGESRSGFKKKETFAPSTIGWGHGNCPRYWYIAFDGAEFEESTDSMGFANMANGTAAHERLENLFESAGILEGKEIEAKLEDPPIRGYIDALTSWNNAVVEFKTTRQESYQIKQTTKRPSPNHLVQILIYMVITGRDAGFIIYENKNTQELLVIPVEKTKENVELINYVFNWLRETRKSWVDQNIPVRPYRPTKGKIHQVCQSCPVKKACYEEYPDGDNIVPRLELPK